MNNYIINGIRDFSFTTYLKAMKVKYELFELFLRENKVHWELDPNKELIEESWDSVAALTVQEAFEEQNQEKRRVLFACLGPSRLFQEVKPELVDRTVLKLKNATWDADGKKTVKTIEDTYELYEIEENKLFPVSNNPNMGWRSQQSPKLRVVRCWCTTTGREYWIFVEDRAAQGWSVWENGRQMKPMKNAIQAIAWTFRVGVAEEDIEAIYRQGDCLVIKAAPDAPVLPQEKWYHLNEETYRKKLIAQS